MASVSGFNLKEDCVEYFLFPLLSSVKDESRSIQDHLDEFCDLYLAELSQFLVQYIWQNEPFRLSGKVEKSAASSTPHLYGRTHVGDNIEDEWFIVFLLRHLTKSFPDLVIRVVDNDGEFLLIEAADHLKKWMKPENCENRVYLYKGNVHVLPQPQNPGQLSSLPVGVPTMAEAVSAVRDDTVSTKVDSKIQKAVWKRIGSYPEKIKDSQHRDHCFVPAAIVAILQARPALLSASVDAFYTRDVVDMKACRAMKYFPPETRVMTEVRFSKCMFAQLMQQKYIPDKRTGWNLPAPNRPEFKAYDLGMKLACGFEILASNAKPARFGSTAGDDVDPELDVRWNRYLQSIKDKGYFRDELEHSKLYEELLKKARAYFVTNVADGKGTDESPGDCIQNLLNSLEVDVDQMKKNSKTLDPPDDDSWLNITPEQLDNLLKEYGVPEPNKCNDEKLSNDIPAGLKAFVSHVSSHEGAEFPKMRNNAGNNKNIGNRITFDPDAFADAMQSILDFKLPDWGEDDRSSSGMSDYSNENEDIDLSKPSQFQGKPKSPDEGMVSDMRSYMDRMDAELAATAVGQTYERTPAVATEEDASGTENCGHCSENGNNLENYQPINLDLTALKNILESYNSQQGLPGPASNLLENMGIQLPQNVDTCDS